MDSQDDDGDASPAEIDGLKQVNGEESKADNGEAEVEGDKKSTESNKADDDVADKTRFWMDHHYGIKDINETDPIYGSKEFKDQMTRFLPYHTKKPANKRW